LSFTGQEIDQKLSKIDNLAAKNEVPTKTSELINDTGYVKAVDLGPLATKEGLTASEVGADAAGTASSIVTTHNQAEDAHADIREEIGDITTALDAIIVIQNELIGGASI
jgi:hypothetical protein